MGIRCGTRNVKAKKTLEQIHLQALIESSSLSGDELETVALHLCTDHHSSPSGTENVV